MNEELIEKMKIFGKIEDNTLSVFKTLNPETLGMILLARQVFIVEGDEGLNYHLQCETKLGRDSMTLGTMAYILGITRERVRQIESIAIKKIQHPKAGRKLKQYMIISKPLSY